MKRNYISCKNVNPGEPKFGVNVETTHRAHINITYAAHYESQLDDPVINELNHFVKTELAKYEGEQVAEDEQFCCNELTEVGLIGSDKQALISVANAVADFACSHPNLKLIA